MKKAVTVVVAVAVLAGGVAIVGSSMSAGVFQLTIEETLASPDRYQDREFKVVGTVVPGSISRRGGPFEMAFSIRDAAGRALPCHYQGTVPDPFAEDREVILQGTLREGPRMEVSKITVKCPSKYEEEGLSEEEAQQYYDRKYRSGHQGPRPQGP